jgi:glycosyltransferase involved in cell wall biosynthesis
VTLSNDATVSVLMVTYKHEAYIAEAIEGVLMQEVDFPLELIIADDCSPDGTAEIVQKHINEHPNGHWIKYTRHETNKGMMPNFIWALEQVQGKFIAMCDGDDYWTDPHKLQKQVDFLEANNSCSYVFTDRFSLLPDGNLFNPRFELPELFNLKLLLERKIMPSTQTVMFTRNKLNKLNEWKDVMLQGFNGDWILLFMLTHDSKIGFIPDHTAVYREGVGIIAKSSIIGVCHNGMRTNQKINKLLQNKYKKYLLNFEWHYQKISIEMFVQRKIFIGFIYLLKKEYYTLVFSKNKFFSKENRNYLKHMVKLVFKPQI